MEREFPLLHTWWRFSASYNVSTRRNVPVIRLHDGESEGVMMRWGLIPDWAEGDARKACTTHASTDELDRNKAFSGAWWRSQRCILPLSGFYGWQLTPQHYLQPFFVRLVNRSVFGVAALWDRSVNKDEDDVIEGCALLTVPSNALLADVHNTSERMPASCIETNTSRGCKAPRLALVLCYALTRRKEWSRMRSARESTH